MSQAVAIRDYSVSDMERMALALSGSKLFGLATPDQALALCLIAQAEGRHPASAAQDYHIIQGKPSKKADAMLRDFMAGGGKVEWHTLSDELADATFSHPSGGTVRISWDMDRAKQAQINTPMWKKYPRQMLRSRVVSEGVRTVFPMATSGMYVPEEVEDIAAEKRSPAPAQEPETVTIDGEVVEPVKTLSKAKARPLDGEMRAELDACATLDDLARLWASKAFQGSLKTLPPDWQRMLEEHKDELKAKLTPPDFVQVAPNFDSMEPDYGTPA